MTATKIRMLTGLSTCMIVAGFSSAAHVQADSRRETPKGWSYEVDNQGRRVAKDKRIVNPDGSWREEIRQGNCLTVKERAATGEYKETRQCKPGKPG